MRNDLAKRESIVEDSRMPSPLDSLTLPNNVTALRTLLLNREQEHAAELEAERAGLKEQVLQNEQLKARLAKPLRQRFGSSSEKMRGAIDQLDLIIGDLEEEIAETTPPEAEPRQTLPRSIRKSSLGGANRNARHCRKTCRGTWWNMLPPVPARNAAARCGVSAKT